MSTEVKLPTKKLDPDQAELLTSLKAGQQIEVVQTVRVGSRQWQTHVKGTFRQLNYLATGLATQRVPEDDIVVPMLHFVKENGEYSSIAIDENSVVRKL
ncbi:hypothetical protein KIH39_00845 [Telmatocola sphagniphila]|uniref:Uncharacterized protein n=1 Tax=Telmatocola sphagniphila TaxID=1123043 RepID=A0A8E6B7C9_9BACT|nr:hypothetical protein [Telmatocola sphagniphila]QVL32496.1 hypothetical protein KIH39_00845 [Telmatocola sphagniphila]